MLAGAAFAAVGVALYALASVLQTIGARKASASTTGSPGFRELLQQRTWVLGLVTLVMAFLAFVASTRTLPLLMAVIIRALYPVLTVVLEHLVFSTRLRGLEVVGAAVVLIGPVVIVASGGERSQSPASMTTTVLMGALLVGVVLLSPAAARVVTAHPALAGGAQAVLAGIAFTVVDIGVRSLPDPFSLTTAMGTPACWIGAAAAPVGLLLFSRAVTSISAGLGTVVLTVVNVVGASAWATLAFGDISNAGPAQYLVAVIAAVLGLSLMTPRPIGPARDVGSV